jgi:hypothetical protein
MAAGTGACGASHAANRYEIDIMADWYYTKNGQQQGPVTSAQLRQLAQSGDLQPTDMVFKEGGSQWVAASTIANLFASSGVSSRASAPERSAREDRDDRSLAFDDGGDDGAPIRRKPKAGGGSWFVEMLIFRRMVGPWVIIILFWLGVVVGTCLNLFSAVMLVYAGGSRAIIPALLSVALIPVSIVASRVMAEILIVVFRIYETLLDMKDILKKQGKS